jgi:hypothetical protein
VGGGEAFRGEGCSGLGLSPLTASRGSHSLGPGMGGGEVHN